MRRTYTFASSISHRVSAQNELFSLVEKLEFYNHSLRSLREQDSQPARFVFSVCDFVVFTDGRTSKDCPGYVVCLARVSCSLISVWNRRELLFRTKVLRSLLVGTWYHGQDIVGSRSRVPLARRTLTLWAMILIEVL